MNKGWELFEFSNSKKLIRMRLKKPGIFTETEIATIDNDVAFCNTLQWYEIRIDV